MTLEQTQNMRALVDEINARKPTTTGTLRRRAEGPEPGTAEASRYELSFSSETPCRRWYGVEILGHHENQIRMQWINSSNAPLLLEHDHSKQIGVIESASIKDRRGKAVARFGKSALAIEIKDDVDDGIRTNISVGYRVHEIILEKKEDDLETYRVVDWEPVEISIVPVPADPNTGTNRSTETPFNQHKQKEKKTMTLKDRATALGLPEGASLEDVIKAERCQAEAAALKKRETAAEKELERQNEIRALADINRAALPDIEDLVKAAIDEKKTVLAFRDQINEALRNQCAKPTRSWQRNPAAAERRDLARFSIIKGIRESMAGQLTGLEAEMQQEAEREARESGLSLEGFSIPAVVMNARALDVSTEGADLVQTTVTGFIELLRNKMVVQSLGARMMTGLSGKVQIPRQSGGAAAAWEGETDSNADQTATFDNIQLDPNRLGCESSISKQLVIQSSPDVEDLVRNDLMTAIALALDLASINGSGSSNQPTGILTTSGIGSVTGGTDGKEPTFDHIVELETKVAVDNADVGALSYLCNAATRGKLKRTAIESGTDASKIWGSGDKPLNGYSCAVSNQVPSDGTKGTGTSLSSILFGNWSDLILAQWGGLDIVVDPYTKASSNQIRLVVNTYADVAVRHPKSFAAIKDVITT